MPGPPDPSDAAPAERDAYAAFRNPAYRSYSIGNFIAVLGRQMLGLAIGYEVFQRTRSATALGLVGLAGALPVILLALPAGQLADRLPRKAIIIGTQFLSLLTSLGLAWLASHAGTAPDWPILEQLAGLLQAAAGLLNEQSNVVFDRELPLIYGLLVINGIARTFGWAARAPFVTNLVPRAALPNAVPGGAAFSRSAPSRARRSAGC